MDWHPGSVLQLWAQLEAGILASQSRSASSGDTWLDTYIYWRQIPKYFFAGVMSKEGAKHGLTTEILGDIDGHDRESFRKVAQLLLGVNPHRKIPKALFVKVAMTTWLLGCLHSLGNRGIKLVKGVSASFAVDWATGGAFTFAQVGPEVQVSHSVLCAVGHAAVTDKHFQARMRGGHVRHEGGGNGLY